MPSLEQARAWYAPQDPVHGFDHVLRVLELAERLGPGPGGRLEAVTHCLRAHRFRGAESPSTLEAQILFDADKLDVLGAFGVARTLGYALQAGQPFFAEPSASFLEPGAPA